MENKKFNTRYLRGQEIIKTRDLSKLLSKQKEEFCVLLESFEKKAIYYENKTIHNQTQAFIDQMNAEDVAYLMEVLPAIIKRGASPEILKYKKLLPKGYRIGFDLPTEPASIYLRELESLHLSQRAGSISKTTNDEIRKLIADGLDEGLSYGEIANKVRLVDPFVFSKARANLIAVQELGQAYGFGNFEPAREMASQGYVMVKRWATSHDDLVRPSHTDNELAGDIPLDEMFPGTDDEYAPSKQFRCRCTSSTEIVGISKGSEKIFLEKYEYLRKSFEK